MMSTGVPTSPNVDAAYKEAIKGGQPLSRGHMNPSGTNKFKKEFLKATFTLTNAAPQFQNFNSKPWAKFEEKIRTYAKVVCSKKNTPGTLYLLTGISNYGLRPDGRGNPIKDITKPPPAKNMFVGGTVRLDTPRAMWTAGCCVWNEYGTSKQDSAESFAVMGNNVNNEQLIHQTQMTVTKLESLLREGGFWSFWKPYVNLFPGDKNCAKNDVKRKL